MRVDRREFVKGAACVAALGATPTGWGDAEMTESQQTAQPAPRPLMGVASGNGVPALERAARGIAAGEDLLDAIVSGINIVEDDPNDHSVGYGGLPNEEGVVELDACVMDGRVHKAGAVAALQRVKNPSSVAALVMRRTDHVLLVGAGALKFAKAHGFPEQELLTDEARRIWLRWKETHSENDDWICPEADKEAARALREMGIEWTTGTITSMALTPAGDIAGCTSTSGLSYKLAGRVGDSPILGAGLFVDNAVGACGSTGRGEANLQNLTSFLVVELMRSGRTPTEACREALQRLAERVEPRLRNKRGEPAFQLSLYAIRKDGLVGGFAMRPGSKMAVLDGGGVRAVDHDSLYSE